MTRKPYATREEWLVAAIDALRPLFAEIDETVPAVRVSVGWPGGRGPKSAVIGQCWRSDHAADGVSQVFISPVLDDAPTVLAVLTHELIHALDDCQHGHRGRFVKVARRIGLEGPATATHAGDALALRLLGIAASLGPYPHAALSAEVEGADGPRKQGTRMLKVECIEGSGYKVRITRTWLTQYGAPLCPCHKRRMVEVE
jgi:hypothetical protein